jgi:DNA-binding SARP family transcriptional activator
VVSPFTIPTQQLEVGGVGQASSAVELQQLALDSTVLPGSCPRLAVYCLGPFECLIEGRLAALRPGKVTDLFQYLVNHHGAPVPRQRLMEVLWANPDAGAPAISMKVTVHSLRQQLAQLSGSGWVPSIETRGSAYVFHSPGLWLDVDEFERCCDQASQLYAAALHAEARPYYQRAALLYRGDFLADSSSDWVALRRENLKDKYLYVLGRLSEAALGEGDHLRCLAYCQQLLEHDPCREDAYRAIMLCHAQLGQRGRVQRWYEVCIQTLRAELGVLPEEQTERVYSMALAGEVSREEVTALPASAAFH